MWPQDLNAEFTLKDCLFGNVITKNADSNKYSLISLPNDWGRNATIFVANMSSSVHANNKNKDILIIGIGETKGLDDTTLTAEAEYSINFSRSQRKSCLSLHYNRINSFLFVNGQKDTSV